MEYYYEQPYPRDVPLRACQEAGQALIEEFEEEISVPYISTLAKNLQLAGVVIKKKRGRNYWLSDGPELEEFMKFLEKSADFGTRLTGNSQDDFVRANALRILEESGSIMAMYPDNLIPSKAFGLLMEKVKAGDLAVAFVQAGLPIGVKYKGKTTRIPFYNELSDDDDD